MAEVFFQPLTEIQPSQLYISQAKLAQVQARWQPLCCTSLPPIPVKLLDDNFIFTDGHTRAFAAFRAGLTEIPVYLDEDDLDWEAYRICVEWCRADGIHTIQDLVGRVVPPDVYAELWLARCRAMHAALAERRGP